MSAVLRPDVAVVGAGPAGSCAAIAAARAGASVVLIDRARFPRKKVCGCCLAERGVARLHALGAGEAIEGAVPLRSLRLRCGTARVVLARDAGVVVARETLDTRLVEVARAAGVEHLEGDAARIEPDRTIAIDGAGIRIVARMTIVADGLAGTSLDGWPDFAWITARRSLMGFGATLPSDPLELDRGEIAMYVGEGGYLGAVRLPDGRLDLAAAVSPSFLRTSGSVAHCARALLIEDLPAEEGLERPNWKGTPLLTRRRARLAAAGILVAGDASGYVEPFTGEGMSWAIETGILAGELAARDPCAWSRWPGIHRASSAPSRLRCRAIAALLRSPMLVRCAMRLARIAPRPFERLAVRIGGEVPA